MLLVAGTPNFHIIIADKNQAKKNEEEENFQKKVYF